MTIKHLYPTQRPSLDLNFARAKRLDPRVDFERFSVGTYVGNDGLIKYAVDHEPRFDHDPVTGESLGLLVEASSTNEFDYSNPVFWNRFGSWSLTGNTTTAPDGTTTAATFEKTSGSRAILWRSTAGTANRTRSFFAKAGTASWVFIERPYVWFNLSNGTIGTDNSGGTASIEALANGWYRCSVYQDNWSVVNIEIGISSADNSVNGNIGDNAHFWGGQQEQGSATSYIPTNGSTVTRAADVASLANTNVYDTDSFTILNDPYGAAAGGSTLNIVGGGQIPVKRTTVYNQELSQSQINTLVKKDDEFWRWRILGSSFALPSFLTDGQVTVDWGDGTVETLTTSEHTFSDGGGYHDIGFRLDNGTYFRPAINNSTHRDKVIALGPAPESMKLNAALAFRGCVNIEAFDATVDATGGTSFNNAWADCSSLTSFPLIDTSSGTDFSIAWWTCSSLTSFPLIDTSSGTSFSQAWQNCTSLTSFPLLNTSSGTNFNNAWRECSSLTSFPLIDTSSATSLGSAWYGCSSLTSFPLINTAVVTNFSRAWQNCTGLTSFPLIDTSSGTTFNITWYNCSSLTDFPANFFDSWTGTPSNNCFFNAWDRCDALTATSVENILNSIDTSGQSAPASGVDITIDYDSGTGTPSISTAVTNLKSRGWTITLNGVAQ